MGGEVDRHAGVLDAHGQRADASGVGAEDPPDAPLGDQLGELADSGVEALDVADHQLHAAPGGRRRPSAARPPGRSRSASRRTRACRRRSRRARSRRGGRRGRRCRPRRRRRAPAASGSRRPTRSAAGRCARGPSTRRARRSPPAVAVGDPLPSLDVVGAHPPRADQSDAQLVHVRAPSVSSCRFSIRASASAAAIRRPDAPAASFHCPAAGRDVRAPGRR